MERKCLLNYKNVSKIQKIHFIIDMSQIAYIIADFTYLNVSLEILNLFARDSKSMEGKRKSKNEFLSKLLTIYFLFCFSEILILIEMQKH